MAANGQEQMIPESMLLEVLQNSGLDPEIEAVVMGGIHTAVENKNKAEQQERFFGGLANIADAFLRTNGSDSGIEGWFEEVEEASLSFLELAATDTHSYDGLREMGTDTAARISMVNSLVAYRPVQTEIFEAAGVNCDQILADAKTAIVANFENIPSQASALQKRLEKFTKLEDFNKTRVWHESYWMQGKFYEIFVREKAEALRTALVEQGVALKELNEDGLFPEEVEDEEF